MDISALDHLELRGEAATEALTGVIGDDCGSRGARSPLPGPRATTEPPASQGEGTSASLITTRGTVAHQVGKPRFGAAPGRAGEAAQSAYLNQASVASSKSGVQ